MRRVGATRKVVETPVFLKKRYWYQNVSGGGGVAAVVTMVVVVVVGVSVSTTGGRGTVV